MKKVIREVKLINGGGWDLEQKEIRLIQYSRANNTVEIYFFDGKVVIVPMSVVKYYVLN